MKRFARKQGLSFVVFKTKHYSKTFLPRNFVTTSFAHQQQQQQRNSQSSINTDQADVYPSRGKEDKIIPRQDPVVWGNQSSGPLSEQELEHYNTKGYLKKETLLNKEEVAAAVEELNKLKTEAEKDKEITKKDERFIIEPNNSELRSIFEVHKTNEFFHRLATLPKIVSIANQILGDEVYIHQSRLNYKPGFYGKEFYWHSDFETWHSEDGMPRMRALSCAIMLTHNTPHNGPLLVIPGSHKDYITCVGYTPEDNYKKSLRAQHYGTPSPARLTEIVSKYGIDAPLGPLGTAIFFDCNIMHGSNSNITPLPRSNAFFVYNSVKNALVAPFYAPGIRPEHIASRKWEKITTPKK